MFGVIAEREIHFVRFVDAASGRIDGQQNRFVFFIVFKRTDRVDKPLVIVRFVFGFDDAFDVQRCDIIFPHDEIVKKSRASVVSRTVRRYRVDADARRNEQNDDEYGGTAAFFIVCHSVLR